MDSVLLDTSVASFFLPHKHPGERDLYRRHLEGRRLVLSFQSVGELWYMAAKNNWGERRRHQLEVFLQRFVVVPADFDLAKCWAEVEAECEKRGRRLETTDLWIVATALRHDLPLVTHDADMLVARALGVQVITELTGHQRGD